MISRAGDGSADECFTWNIQGTRSLLSKVLNTWSGEMSEPMRNPKLEEHPRSNAEKDPDDRLSSVMIR